MPSFIRRPQTPPGGSLLALLLLCAAGCAAPQAPAPAPREISRYTIEQFLDTTGYSGASFSHDGAKILVSSDQTGVFNAFAIPVAGGDPAQLTASTTESILIRSNFPRDDRFLYVSDQGGNELTHLYVRELDGTVTDLTPGENLKAEFEGWADDDRSFFVTTNERDPKHFDLYEVATDGYARTLLYRNESGYAFRAISPDKQLLAFAQTRTTTDSDLMLHDRRSGETTNLTPHEGEALNEAQEFGPGGQHLYYLSNEGSEFLYLVRHHLGTGERQVIVQPDWDVIDARLSPEGTYLMVRINDDGRTEVQLLESATLKPVALPHLPIADITLLTAARDEARLAFYANGSRAPNDLYVLNLGSGETRRLTESLSPEIDPADLVEVEVARFASYDGVEIPGLLYRPHQATATAKAPALVWVHGGPGDQSRVGYSGLLQYLVNHGYVVYAINNRGSSGYGKTFFGLDDRKHGDADLGDCVASKDFLTGTGYVDPNRIGIIGGSYGGYMVLAALAYRPDEFAAGVDIFGVANWVRTLKSIPPYWESFRLALYQELGDPAVDEEYLHRISPLFHAGNINKPLLVLQGANDPRVLKVESDDMVAAARANGAPVEYLVFDDEGHGFRKKKNQEEGYSAILKFLDKHLAGAPELQDDGPPA
jgi:dipeptidyl aminopeptidase/acylaminoacyl peptidase